MNKKISAFAFYTAPIFLLLVLFLAACSQPAQPGPNSQNGVFTVKFTNTGATIIQQQSVQAGDLSEEPPAPLRDGYNFTGWSTSGSTYVPFDFNTPITGNLVLYARWVQLFTVTFTDSSGDTITEPQTVEKDKPALKPVDPDREGYIFLGWYILNGSTYVLFNFNTSITGDIDLYADWIKLSAGFSVITFDADGGIVDPGSIQINTGDPAGTLPYPLKDNSYFQGWFTQKNGAGTEFTSSSIVSADITVFAKWGTFAAGTNNVAFESNGGTSVAPRTNVPTNTSIMAPASPAKQDYAFEGWYKDPDFTTRWYFAPVNGDDTVRGDKVNGNVILYAKWLPVGGPEQSGMYSSNGASLQLHVGGTTGVAAEQVNRIYNSNGKMVRLVGVNVPSLDWGKGESVVWSEYEVFTNWNANFIRLPVYPDGWLGLNTGTYGSAANYMATVDRVVDLANQFGKYIILDNHEYTAPTQKTLDFWTDAAARYRNNPAVLFGLLNEPHDVSWDIWQNGGTSGGNTYIGHQQLVDAIRALGADNILIAGGLEYGYTLDGISANNFARMLVDTPQGRGIMYDSHAYPWKDSKGFPTSATKVLPTATRAPILIGEFGIEQEGSNGGGDPNMTNTVLQKPWYIGDILDWMELNGFNFTAWDFHPSSAPRMVLNDSNWTSRINVTPNQYFGQQVYARLKSYPNSNSHLNPIPARPANGN